MSATVRQVGIRLALQGANEVSRGLREVGNTGERSLERITQSAGAAGTALRLLGPILGGLGAGLGIGSLVGMAQNWIGGMAADMLGLRDNTDAFRQSVEIAMNAVRDEGRAAETTLREIGDLFLTAAQRAASLANAQRENLRLQTELRLGNAIQLQDAAAGELPGAQRELARIHERLRNEQALQDRARRAGALVPQDGSSDAQRELFSATARIEGLRAELALQQRRIGEINEARARLANAGVVGVDQFGPNAPSATRAGAGRAAGRETDYSRQIAAAADRFDLQRGQAATQLNAIDQAANLQSAGLERAAPVLQAYERQMQTLNDALRTGVIGQDDFSERVRVASEALEGQIEQAQRAGEAVSGLSRETSRFAQSAVSDFVKAAIAGKNLSDTLSNILSRLGDLFLNQAFSALFGGGGGGGGFNLFSAISGAIFGARANGGPVEAGRPYMVGERGPEMFIPRGAGTVMRNGESGGGVNLTQNFDFRGATVDEVKFRRIAREESQRAVGGLVESRRESRSVLA